MQIKKLSSHDIESMYEKHGAALTAYACCFGLDHALAEDVVQKLFLKILGQRGAAPELQAAYLFGATRNAALNMRRDRRRDTELPAEELWLAHPQRSREEILNVQNELGKLPEEQREAVYLRIWAGMTLQEIADLTYTPPNTVASRYRYGIGKLRERFSDIHKQKR